MGTSYYLADSRYMKQDEIEQAFLFNDNAIICRRMFDGLDSEGKSKLVYRLFVPNILFFNLPEDVSIVNNNNDVEVETIGDLVSQIRRTNGRIITIDEGIEKDRESERQWIEFHRNMIGWRNFLCQNKLIEPLSAMQYLSRRYRNIQ